MEKYPEYSKNLWDYLNDMPYMPSRKDREQFIEKNDKKHLEIWDYFFRIREEDVGKPQKGEIEELNNDIEEKTKFKNEKISSSRSEINSLDSKIKELRGKKAKNGVLRLIVGFLVSIAGVFIVDSGEDIGLIMLYACGMP